MRRVVLAQKPAGLTDRCEGQRGRNQASCDRQRTDSLEVPEAIEASMETPMKYLTEIKGSSAANCPAEASTQAHAVWAINRKVEATVWLANCDLVAIMETWWNEFCDGSAATGCPKGTGEEGGVEVLPSMAGKRYNGRDCP